MKPVQFAITTGIITAAGLILVSAVLGSIVPSQDRLTRASLRCSRSILRDREMRNTVVVRFTYDERLQRDCRVTAVDRYASIRLDAERSRIRDLAARFLVERRTRPNELRTALANRDLNVRLVDRLNCDQSDGRTS